MKEKIISEINLDLVFQCNDFSQFSNKFKDTKSKFIFESIFWEKVFLSWINSILVKDDITQRNLSSAEKLVIKNYLIEQKVAPNLFEDNESFLSELHFQIKCVIENIGISTKEFLIDNDSFFFYPKGEERLSFIY